METNVLVLSAFHYEIHPWRGFEDCEEVVDPHSAVELGSVVVALCEVFAIHRMMWHATGHHYHYHHHQHHSPGRHSAV